MSTMVLEPTQTAAVVVVLMVTVTAATPATTFLAVAQDMAPHPSATSNITTVRSLAECGQLCFAATAERCLAFVWRPTAPPRVLIMPLNKSSSSSSSGGGGGGEGRCEMLSCLPHPASLTPLPGAHVFVIKMGDSTAPPPAFTPTLVPSSYSMACTFAFRVFAAPRLGHWQAGRRCALDGARLIVFKSPEEEEVIRAVIKPSEPYWIGLTDRQREGVWRWADRSKLTYTNWYNGQPNNYQRGNKDQDCVMLFKGHWNDNQCHDALRFICQVPLLHR